MVFKPSFPSSYFFHFYWEFLPCVLTALSGQIGLVYAPFRLVQNAGYRASIARRFALSSL
jgi:hypothetical protein